jgi:putative tryptophan/tyrosine transport system substrate-binding protein
MKKRVVCFLCAIVMALVFYLPCSAQERVYRIDALQITDLLLYRMAYEGFVGELEKNGLVEGKNLKLTRTVIDFDIMNPSIWNKMKGVWNIKSEASHIAADKPDLALTIGAPVTKYARNAITGKGIPLVFTAVVSPVEVGSASPTEGGPGFTGASSSMDIGAALKVVRLVFPGLKTIGIVHSVDDFARMGDPMLLGQSSGFTIITKQVGMGDPILPALESLRNQGAEAFAVPPDPYYSIRKGAAVEELVGYSKEKGTPIISLVIAGIPGAALSVGVDLRYIGALSGHQAAMILLKKSEPESLPILRQKDLTIRVDENIMQALGIELPPEIRSRAGSSD